jgi:hypothetical protein
MTFPELLESLGVTYTAHGESTKVSHGWVGYECPFCGQGSGVPGLGYNLRTGALTCWKCGGHGWGETLAALCGLPLPQCRVLLQNLDRGWLTDKEPRLRGKFSPPAGVVPLSDPAARPHRQYLTKRGFDPDEIEQLWGLGALPRGGPCQWRVFIPVHLGGEPVSWTARSIGEKLRYKSAQPHEEKLPLKSLLYGEDYCRHAVVVHEGPADVWATGPGAVATLGVACSRAQVLRIAGYPVRAVCFDRGAEKQAERLCRELAVFPGQTYLVTLTGKDPASSPARERRELRKRFLD